MQNNYLIIGGTEKSGTTSLYHYLSAHPAVTGSLKKETDFFRVEGGAVGSHRLTDYKQLFPSASAGAVYMEASPGYLADSAHAAAAIATLLPQARLIFVLRDPIDRLISSFQFHQSRLYLPESMSFDTYIELCMMYEKGEVTPASCGLKEWFLRVPDAGLYARHLKDFYEHFPREQIRVVAFDELGRDARAVMRAIAQWAGLDPAFYQDYEFERSNVTFAARRAWLQRLALFVNRRCEPFFNRFPGVKRRMLAIYKTINGRSAERPLMSAGTQARLVEYYRQDVEDLVLLVGQDIDVARNWLKKHHGK